MAADDATIVDRRPDGGITSAPRAAGIAEDAQSVLAAVHGMASEISARADEVEAARRLPLDLVDEMSAVGCFRLVVPHSHRGIGATLPDALQVFESLSMADGSVGWCVALGVTAWCDLVGLPRATFDAMFADGPDVIIASVFNPSGVATKDSAGYRVSGRWAFASGCEHAHWLYGNCIVANSDPMQLRTILFKPTDVTIEDTWYVEGLRGTGSHHFRVDELTVPIERTYATLEAEPCVDTPLAHVPPPALFSTVIAAIAVGIAQGALDEILEMSTAKVPLLGRAPLAANPLFQHDYASAETGLRAARSLLYDEVESLWSSAVDAREMSPEHRAHVRATAAWVTAEAAGVVEVAYRVGGGTAVYDTCALQRRMRDIHAVTQHFLVKDDTFTTAGALLADQQADILVF